MRHNTQLFKALVLGILIGGCFFMLLGRACHSNELEAAPLLMCDTQTQAETLGLTMDPQDPSEAVNAVNDDARVPHACGKGDVVFLRGDVVSKVVTEGATYQIVKVMILGQVGNKHVEWSDPVFQYAIEKVDERQA